MSNYTHIATQDTDILYSFRHGGGLNGRTVKKGDRVTLVTGNTTNIDTPVVRCLETLNWISREYFNQVFAPIQEPVLPPVYSL